MSQSLIALFAMPTIPYPLAFPKDMFVGPTRSRRSCLWPIRRGPSIAPHAMVAAWVLFAANFAAAAVEYSVTDLGNFQATGANNLGQVVGYAQAFPGGLGPNNDSYLSDNGTLIDLTKTYGLLGVPLGIGDDGQIVGEYPIHPTPGNSGVSHAFAFSAGKFTDLGSLGAFSTALHINAAGEAIGSANPSPQETSAYHAVLYTGGKAIDLGTLGGDQSTASGINDSGQIVGLAQTRQGTQHPFLYQNGHMTDLLPLSSGGFAAGINNRGQIVGGEVVGTVSSGGREPVTYSLIDVFLYQNGTITDLGRLGDHAEPSFINDSGEIVGTYSVGRSTPVGPFVYRDGRFENLNSLIDPRLHIQVEWPYGLNDAGQIIVRGQVDVFPASRTDTLLLTPIPEPAAIWLLLPAAYVARRRRK